MIYSKIIYEDLHVDIVDDKMVVVKSFGPFINNEELNSYIDKYLENVNSGKITVDENQ